MERTVRHGIGAPSVHDIDMCKTQSPALNTGDWLGGEGACGEGGGFACAGECGIEHEYYGFEFCVPPKSMIRGIEVRDDSWFTGAIQAPRLQISLSWDGGASWTTPRSHSLTSSETTYVLGGADDTWGRTWLTGEVNSDDFRIKIESCSGLMLEGSELRQDWLRITVHYAEPVDHTPPIVRIIDPKEKTYCFDTSIPLNYEASDDVAIDECWFNIDGGTDITIKHCDNTVFQAAPGPHTLRLFVKDTSGKIAWESVDFSIALQPAMPILAVYDRSLPPNYYDHFIGEILRTEGIMASQKIDLSYYRNGMFPLEAFDLVILADTSPLTASEVGDFKRYVRSGGNLLGIKCDTQLAEIFGVIPLNMTLKEGYVRIDDNARIGCGLERELLQYHSVADLYDLDGADAVAWLYSDRNNKTGHPAVTQYRYGSGRSVLFTYPLVKSVVLLHQGDDTLPDMTDADGDGVYRPQDYFAHGFYDLAAAGIPQADEHQAALVASIYHLMSCKRPLPRVWYFPNHGKCVCLISSDSGGDDGGRDVEVEYHSNTVESYGGYAHYNILDLDLSVGEYNILVGEGHTVSPHTYAGDKPTLGLMRACIRNDVTAFLRKYEGMGRVHTAHSNGFVGYWETAKYFSDNGLKMSAQNGGPINDPPYYGYMFGSALPFKLAKNEGDNSIIDAWQLPIVISDMVMISGGKYDETAAKSITGNVLDKLMNSYYGVARINFHASNVYNNAGGYERDWFDYTLNYCNENSIPMWSSDRFYNYWLDRYWVELENIQCMSDVLSFEVWGAPDDATIMVPNTFEDRSVEAVFADEIGTDYRIAEIDGVSYASFVIDESTRRIEVRYGPEAGRVIAADLEFVPRTLNLKNHGRHVTCHMELSEGHHPSDIDVSTVMLNEAIPAEASPAGGGDYDGDGIPDRVIKFNMKDLIALLVGSDGSGLCFVDQPNRASSIQHGADFEVAVRGELTDGTPFSGTDVIRVINPGGDLDQGSGGNAALGVFSTVQSNRVTISYEISIGGPVTLRIHDAAGRLVRDLVSEHKPVGRHEVTWDRRAYHGGLVNAGVYFVRLEQPGMVNPAKLLIAK